MTLGSYLAFLIYASQWKASITVDGRGGVRLKERQGMSGAIKHVCRSPERLPTQCCTAQSLIPSHSSRPSKEIKARETKAFNLHRVELFGWHYGR